MLLTAVEMGEHILSKRDTQGLVQLWKRRDTELTQVHSFSALAFYYFSFDLRVERKINSPRAALHHHRCTLDEDQFCIILIVTAFERDTAALGAPWLCMDLPLL